MRARADDAALVPMLAALFGFVFFSLSRSQLPPYMTPIAPALAVLAGIGLDRFLDVGAIGGGAPPRAGTAWIGWFVAAIGACAAAVGGVFAWRGVPIHGEVPAAANVWILACGAALAVSGGVAAVALRAGRRGAGVGALAAGMAGALLVSTFALDDVGPILSCAPFEQDLRGRPADAPLVTLWDHPDGIEFYAKGEIIHAVPTRIGCGDPFLAPGEAATPSGIGAGGPAGAAVELKNPLGSDLWSCARFGGEAARRKIVYGDEALRALSARLDASGKPYFVLVREKHAEDLARWFPGDPRLVRTAGERRLYRFGG